MGLKALFTKHPNSVDETYLRHLGYASFSALKLLGAGLALLVHAVFPFLFVTTACDCITKMYAALDARKQKANAETLG